MTWRLGPGDRVALVGVNGSGKTSLAAAAGGRARADARAAIERGSTVRIAYLSQEAVEIPGHLNVLESLEEVRGHATLSGGEEITAAMLCERFGFRGEKARTLVDDLSGGERRRLALMRLLMAEPNVLLLDEPTNDLDIDTLTALEDLLDGWPGTLVVVSHDRYFVERVCDDVHALTPDGGIRHLPGGIDQYLEQRRDAAQRSSASASSAQGRRSAGGKAARRAQGDPAHRARGKATRTRGRAPSRARDGAGRADDGRRDRPRKARRAAGRARAARRRARAA